METAKCLPPFVFLIRSCENPRRLAEGLIGDGRFLREISDFVEGLFRAVCVRRIQSHHGVRQKELRVEETRRLRIVRQQFVENFNGDLWLFRLDGGFRRDDGGVLNGGL